MWVADMDFRTAQPIIDACKAKAEELQKKGYECRDCRGNFIFVKPRHDAKEITKRLEEEKQVLVHAYGNELLKDDIRVSVGSKEAMQIFLDAFFEVDAD